MFTLKIEKAAIRYKGKVYTGKRHNHCLIKIFSKTGEKAARGFQGFVDSKGNFHNRVKSAKIAIDAGQIKELKYHTTQLFSEDLY